MNNEPQKEHQWLLKLTGNWTYEAEATMKPGEPPAKSGGKQSNRSLGGFWIIGEGEGEMPGCGVAKSILTLGYDLLKERYVGTWVGSMMSQMWVYDGRLDAGENVLTLDTEGPGMDDQSKLGKYQDVLEFKNDDHWILKSQALGADGTWHVFMTAHYRRNR